VVYRETLWPSPWLLIAVLPLGPALWLGILPFNPDLGAAAGVIGVLALWALQIARATRISVSASALKVGSAELPMTALGVVETLTGTEAASARGPKLHPGAFRVFRAGIKSYVKVEVLDSQDPTPYWLVSTRQPELLAAALDSQKARF